MFRKKLDEQGAHAQGVIIKYAPPGPKDLLKYITVRVKLPDGSTTDFKKSFLAGTEVGPLYEGTVVPVRYDPSNHSKVELDVPAMKASRDQATAAHEAQLDAEAANVNEPGPQGVGGPPVQVIPGLGDLGTLKAQILQAAGQNPDAVVNLSSTPAGSTPDPVDRLAKLAALKQQGLLSDAEFDAAKAKVLGDG
jgi:hypothetical protein